MLGIDTPIDSSSLPVQNETIQVRFRTREEKHQVPETPIVIPTKLKPQGLSEIINHLLQYDEPIPFNFSINDLLLKTSLSKFLIINNISRETVLSIEYFEALTPPQEQATILQDDWISSIAIHPTSSLIAVGCYDNSLRFYDMEGTSILKEIVHQSIVRGVKWYPHTDNTLLTVSHDSLLKFWKYHDETGVLECQVEGQFHKGNVSSVDIGKNEELIATGSYDQTTALWKAKVFEDAEIEEIEVPSESKKRKKETTKVQKKIKSPLASLTGHRAGVTVTHFGDETIFTGSLDHTIRVWDLATQQNLSTLASDKVIHDLSYSTENRLLLSAHSDHFLRLWDPRLDDTSNDTRLIKSRFPHNTSWLSQVRWCPSSSIHFGSTSYDGSFTVWDLRATNTPLYKNQLSSTKLLAMDWANGFICTGGEEKSIFIFRDQMVQEAQK